MSFFSSHPTSSLSSHPKPWAALAPSGGCLSSSVTLVVAAVGPLRAPETETPPLDTYSPTVPWQVAGALL